jgi:DNA sulfur modification protein DndC
MNATLFDGARLQMTDAIRMTADSLRAYGERYKHWCLAWSGGKDSTATLTVTAWMIEAGMVPRPRSLSVLYADTRQELLPLWLAAADVRDDLAERRIPCQTVMAELDRRMWVYILGRGVPPPNNNTLRYCTRQIKIEPMKAEIARRAAAAGEKVLVLTGVRLGESAARDQRIALSCSTNGAECGQGWFQETLPGAVCDTLSPLLHWRVCHVWEWLKHWAPRPEYGDWSTRLLADVYGGDEAEEVNARTGCVACPLASRDKALDALTHMPAWSYLAPLKKVRGVYEEMREPRHRLRKPGGERRKDGTLATNQGRLGPLTLGARLHFLGRVLDIQAEVNAAARRLGRPPVDHLSPEEAGRVRELIAAGTWPDGWEGTEPLGDTLRPEVQRDGSVQQVLFLEDSFS